MKHIFSLLALCLLHFAASAIELHIPAKPDDLISDTGHVFSASEKQLIGIKINEVKSKSYGVGIYVLTIDASYLPHIDKFVPLVCEKWGICGADNTCLIVIANNIDHDRFLFTGRALNLRFNDTINDYIASIAQSQYKKDPETTPNAYNLVDGMLDMISDRMTADLSTDRFNKELQDFKNNYGKTSSPATSWFRNFFSNFSIWGIIGVLIGLIAGIIVASNVLRKV